MKKKPYDNQVIPYPNASGRIADVDRDTGLAMEANPLGECFRAWLGALLLRISLLLLWSLYYLLHLWVYRHMYIEADGF